MFPHHGQFESVPLYLVDLGARGLSLEDALNWLTPAERRRYEKLIEGTARQRFATGRAALRSLVGAPSGSGDFSVGPHGKPHFTGCPHFSFAASGHHALIGVSARGPIGVDIETVRDVQVPTDWPEIYPPLRAVDRGTARSGEGSAVRFLRAWTRLEALVKRDGGRLSQALDLSQLSSGLEADPSQVIDVELGDNLVGALAFHGNATVELRRVALAPLLATKR